MSNTTRIAPKTRSPGTSMIAFTQIEEGQWSGEPTPRSFEIETDFTLLNKEDVVAAVIMGDISGTVGAAGYRAEITRIDVAPSANGRQKIVLECTTTAGGAGAVVIKLLTFVGFAFGR